MEIKNTDLIFKEIDHTYVLHSKNIILPSVTQIMAPLSSYIYKDIPTNIVSRKANVGSDVHHATELYDLYKVEDIKEEEKGYLEAYKKFVADYKPQMIFIELQHYHTKYYYAGTIDRLALIDNKCVLFDIKTTEPIHPELVAVQTSAYERIFKNENIEVDERATLLLRPDGSYEFIRDLPDRWDIFESLLKIHYFKPKIK
jgi:hypothetical protein